MLSIDNKDFKKLRPLAFFLYFELERWGLDPLDTTPLIHH
jgi:hypothetical protein